MHLLIVMQYDISHNNFNKVGILHRINLKDFLLKILREENQEINCKVDFNGF